MENLNGDSDEDGYGWVQCNVLISRLWMLIVDNSMKSIILATIRIIPLILKLKPWCP